MGSEDRSEEEVALTGGEVAEDGDTSVEAKDCLGDVLVFLKEFRVDADIGDHFELGFLV